VIDSTINATNGKDEHPIFTEILGRYTYKITEEFKGTNFMKNFKIYIFVE